MRIIINIAVLALVGAISIDKKSSMHMNQRMRDDPNAAQNDDIDMDLQPDEGLHQMLDKPMSVDVLNGLTETKSVNSSPLDGQILPPKQHVSFDEPYDHQGHQDQIPLDIGSVKIEKSVEKTGPLCQLNEWAVVNWKSYSLSTGQETKTDGSSPAAWQIGQYTVSKCWDIAIQQMRGGEKASVTCPANLVDHELDIPGDH